MFAIGVALAVPPLRAAFVQLSGAVGIPISSTSGGGQSTNGDGTPAGSATGSAGGGTSAAQGSVPPIACASGSASSAQAKSTKAANPGDLGDAERHPGELGEHSFRQRHGQRDERRPGRRQHQPGRQHDPNYPGDWDRERHHDEHRHLEGFGEGQR